MGVQWGDIEVTVKDIRTSNNVFKVSWPPVLFPKAWTALYLRLHYQHLLQLAFIPHDAMQQPRSFTFHPVILKPLAASIKLERGGITRLRLTLLTRNISLEYTVNCNQGKSYYLPDYLPFPRLCMTLTNLKLTYECNKEMIKLFYLLSAFLDF
nr:uncharacterized protein LOC128694794 [Cherax quadricarinatus]